MRIGNLSQSACHLGGGSGGWARSWKTSARARVRLGRSALVLTSLLYGAKMLEQPPTSSAAGPGLPQPSRLVTKEHPTLDFALVHLSDSGPQSPHLPDEEVNFCLVHLKGMLWSSERSRARRTEWRPGQGRRSNQELQKRWTDPNQCSQGADNSTGTGATAHGSQQNSQSEPSQVIWVLKEKQTSVFSKDNTNPESTWHNIMAPSAIQNYQHTKSHENRKTLNLIKGIYEQSRANGVLHGERLNTFSCELYLTPHKNEIKMDHTPKYNT